MELALLFKIENSSPLCAWNTVHSFVISDMNTANRLLFYILPLHFKITESKMLHNYVTIEEMTISNIYYTHSKLLSQKASKCAVLPQFY